MVAKKRVEKKRLTLKQVDVRPLYNLTLLYFTFDQLNLS